MSKKILFVDDDDLVRELVKHYISHHSDYELLMADSGSNGIALFESEHPDLVMLDIAMPGMSGFEVASQMRTIEEEEQRPHTPIVILTAYARSFFMPAGSDPRIDSYLRKPITSEALLRHIEQFLKDAPTA